MEMFVDNNYYDPERIVGICCMKDFILIGIHCIMKKIDSETLYSNAMLLLIKRLKLLSGLNLMYILKIKESIF